MTTDREPTGDDHNTRNLVLIPGMMCDEGLWVQMEPHLPAGVHVHHAVLRGDTISTVVENILAGAPERFTVVGLSLGGIVAMHLAARAPERLDGFVVLASNARAPRPDQFRGWHESKMRLANGASAASEQERILGSLLSVNAVMTDPKLTERVVGMAERIGAAGVIDQLSAQESRRDYLRDLVGITCPGLVLAGSEDALCPVPVMREIADWLPNSTFGVISGAGHLTPMERPWETGTVIAEWFDANVAPRRTEREVSRL